MKSSPLRFIPVPALLVRKENSEVLEGNSLAAELIGIPVGELQGKDGASFFPGTDLEPGDRDGVLFQTDRTHQFEVDMKVQPFEEEGLSCYIVTLQKKTIHLWDLGESEEKFKFFAESTFEGIVVHNMGIVLDSNESFLEMTGYSHNEAIGKNLLDYIPKASDRARILANMLKKRSKPYHVTAKKKDGSIFIVEIESKDVIYLGKKVRISAIRDVTKQITLQEKLKESEERYRTVFEKTGTATIIVEKENIISLANSRFARLVGYEVKEIVNRMKWTDFVFEADIERMKQWHEIRRITQGKAPTEYEFRLVDRYKNIKHISLVADLIPGTEQTIASLIDITERKKAEVLILESESSLKNAQTIAKLGSWSINMNNHVVNGSEEALKIYGLTGQTLTLDIIQKIPLPEYREMLDSTLANLISGKSIYDVEFKLKNQKSGQTIDVRSIAEYNPEEKIVTGVIQDVTRMKEAESLILQNEQYLKSIFRAAPVGIGVVVNRHFTGVNEKLCKLTGYTENELLHQPARMLYLSDNDYEYVGIVKYREIEKRGTGSIETQWKCKDGSIKDILLSSTPMDTDDLQKGVTFTAMDITDRKKAELDLIAKNRELRLARDKAEESDQLKTAFLANMSHEIRTPMNGILGFTNLLANPSLSEETMQGYIDIINKSGERLLATVNDLIDISKLETGQVNIVVDNAIINELLDTLYHFFHQEASEKGLQLICKKGIPDQALIIRTDEQKLNSVLTNLIKNAIKYTREGSVEFGYTLASKERNKMLQFYIKDTGIGIPKARQRAVFNRFEQADIKDRNAYEGSGLGLAIAKSLVEMLGGNIWLESTIGSGSTFFFTLPYIISERKEPVNIEVTPASQKTKVPKSLKILIAEDDIASFLHLSILTKELTRELLHVTTGREAVEACRDHPDIDLVMMDIKMPNMNGLEATGKIREFNQSVPIIAQTAYALIGDREKALAAGCNDYITKPILAEELMEKLTSLIK
jgi:PAS domain S-box-containing protein